MELQSYDCVLCNSSTEESLCHLLIKCPFATACWNWIGIQVDDQLDLFQNLELFRRQLQAPFFMEAMILMCWTIWQARKWAHL